MQKFSLGINFRGQATPTKLKPTKICTDERLARAITVGYPQSRKFIPMKIYPHEILGPRKFLRLRYGIYFTRTSVDKVYVSYSIDNSVSIAIAHCMEIMTEGKAFQTLKQLLSL